MSKSSKEHDLSKNSGGLMKIGKEAFNFFDGYDLLCFDISGFYDN
jgi:hypothetical protein